MNTTDLETAAESLLFDPTIEAEEAEATQDDAPEVEETEIVEEDDQEEDDNSADDVEYELDESNDEDDAAEKSDGDEKPLSYTVKVDGVDTAVTLDDLTRSYSGQAYIQKRMQETAEGRKQFQADQQRFSDAVQKLQTTGLIPQPQRPDNTMLDTDPIGYMRAQAQYDVELADYTAQQTQLSETTNRTREYQAQQSQADMQKQAARLVEMIPDFADPEKARVLKSKLVDVGQSAYGYSAEELAGLTDARAVSVLNDAMRWRELQSGTAAAKTTPKPQKSVKPTGRRSQPKSVVRDKQLAKARKSGSSEDFMALMFEQNQ